MNQSNIEWRINLESLIVVVLYCSDLFLLVRMKRHTFGNVPPAKDRAKIANKVQYDHTHVCVCVCVCILHSRKVLHTVHNIYTLALAIYCIREKTETYKKIN
jgi:hypothetical protein